MRKEGRKGESFLRKNTNVGGHLVDKRAQDKSLKEIRMKHLWELQKEIEIARKKLDEAMESGYEEDSCYRLSVELDVLIEKYLDMVEGNPLPVN